MADKFPKDCYKKNCPHFKCWETSIADICCYCDLLKVECDAGDEDFSFILCPMSNTN